MDRLIAISALVATIVGVIAGMFRPKWSFYIFLFLNPFGALFAATIYASGNLGFGWTWEPSDILVWVVLAVSLLLPKPVITERDPIGVCLWIIAVLAALSLALGIVLRFEGAFRAGREMYGVGAALFARRYLVNADRISGFLRFCILVLLAMFVVHVLVRFGVYAAPIEQWWGKGGGQLGTERGEVSVTPVLYLALMAIGIGRLAGQFGRWWVSSICLLAALSGIVLSETRTLYFGVLAMGLLSLLFIRRRVQVLAAYGLGLALTLAGAEMVGFDITSRFRTKFGRGEVDVQVMDLGYRNQEYGALWSSMASEPYGLLIGRGAGALHYIPVARVGDIPFWHSEYLMWLDRFGVVGFATLCVAMGVTLIGGYRLARTREHPFSCFATIGFLLVATLLIMGVVNPTFFRRQATLLLCFLPLVSNSRILAGRARPPGVDEAYLSAAYSMNLGHL